jgi:hypothetical protein
LRINRVLGPASLLLLLLPGLYMAYTTWTFEPIWIRLPFWMLVVVMLIGGLVTGRQTIRLTRELEASWTQGSQPDGRRRQSLLASSWFVRTALLLGASFLMVTKPTPGVCALVLGCALAAGLLASLTQLRTAPVQSASAARE